MLEKIHKFANATSRPIARYGTQKRIHKQMSGVVQPRDEPKCEIHENALVAQHQRDTSTIAQQADTKLVHNLLSKNAMTSTPSMLYVWFSDDMIQDDRV